MIRNCELCGNALAGNVRAERITGMCHDCIQADPEEFEERWNNYMHEQDETVEANSK